MAINYEKVNDGNGWTTQTSLGPTNLNHMESGIKSACDSIDTDCVQVSELTPIADYELVSADVATKAINDGNGNNIANQFASLQKFEVTRQQVSLTLSSGLGTASYVDLTRPSSDTRWIPIAVNDSSTSLAVQCTCSMFGGTPRLALFNTHTGNITINTSVYVVWIYV